MENLLELDLSCNQITSVPNSIKRLTKLTHLNLESNKLEMLPVSSVCYLILFYFIYLIYFIFIYLFFFYFTLLYLFVLSFLFYIYSFI